jgi:hypothetical protein
MGQQLMPNLPEIPVFDSALGLISALLLLAAAFYLVRARSSASPGLPSLQRERKGQSAGGEIFAEFVPDETARRLSLVGSLFLHVLLVASLPVIELLAPSPLLFDMNRYDVVILQYQIRDAPLRAPSELVLADKPSPERGPAVPSQRDPLGLPDAENEQTQKAAGPFEGPVIQITAGEQEPTPPLIEVLLQSELPATLPEAARALPSVIVWNLEQQQAETLALIRPKRFEMQGQPEEAPGENPSLADLGLGEAPPLIDNPALPVPAGSLVPSGELWRSLDGLGGPPALALGGAFSSPGAGWGGDSVSALALQTALQHGPLSQLFGGRGGAAWGGSGENVPFRAGAADGPEGGGWGRGRLTPVPRKFHGIILVSNSLSTLPEAIGVLTGNPVYTVYVDVPGAPRKWVLQFCVPQTQGSMEFTGEIVQVLNRKSVNPPYAVRREPVKIDIIPTLERLSELPPRVVAYATVDAEGNLHNLRIIRGADPSTDSLVLASLRNWEFVPAFRDGQPVEVEALFGIPLY